MMQARSNANFSSFNRDEWTPRHANDLNAVSMPDYSQLFDQDTGKPYQMLANDIVQTTIMFKNDFMLSDILPQKYAPETSIQVNQTIFEPTLMDENPELGEAKLLTFSRSRRTVRIQRRGIQAAMEDGFKNHPLGKTTWGRYMYAMARSGIDTLIVHGILALQNAEQDIPEVIKKRDQRYAGKSSAYYMMEQAAFYGIVQTSKRPFEALDSHIRQAMAIIGGDYDTIILPSKLSGYVKAAKSYYLDYDKAGPAGPALAKTDPYENQNPSSYPGFSNTRLYVIHTNYEAAALNNNSPLLTDLKEIGEFYHLKSHVAFDNPNWAPENQQMEVYDEDTDERCRIVMLDCIKNALVFGSDNKIRPLADLKYEHGDAKFDPTSRTHGDMWSVDENIPIHRFGDMHSHNFDISAMTAWANGVTAMLDKRGYITKKQWDEISAALSTVSTNKGLYDLKGLVAATRSGLSGVIALLKSIFYDEDPEVFNPPDWISDKSVEAGFFVNAVRPYFPPLYKMTGAGNPEQTAAYKLAVEIARGEDNLNELVKNESPDDVIRILKRQARVRAYYLVSGAETKYQFRFNDEDVPKLSPEKSAKAEELAGMWANILDKFVPNPAINYKVVPDSYVSKEQGQFILDSGKFDQMPGDLLQPWRPMTVDELKLYLSSNSPVVWNSEYDLGGYGAVSFLDAEKIRRQRVVASEFSQSIGAPYKGQDFFASELYSIDLGFFAESNLLRNWSRLTRHLTGLSRVIMSLFLTTTARLSFFERLHNFGLPVPFEAVVMRPFIRHQVASGIACKRGMENLGYSAVGDGMFTQGSDPGPQSTTAHFTQYLGAVITHPWNALNLEALMCVGYYRGKGCGWIDPEREMMQQSEQADSMIPHILPLGTKLPAVISITGTPNDLEEFSSRHIQDEAPIPNFIRLRKTFGTLEMYNSMTNDQNQAPLHVNFVCMAGKYWYRGEREFDQIHSGRGHFKDTDAPGAKAVREGGLMAYRSSNGDNYKH